jgi:hypothetical protein
MIARFVDAHIKKINFVFNPGVGKAQNRQISYFAIAAFMLLGNFVFRDDLLSGQREVLNHTSTPINFRPREVKQPNKKAPEGIPGLLMRR